MSAGETKQWSLTAALRSSHLPPNLASAGLEFEYTGAPGSVAMAAQRVSGDGNGVFRVPLLDPAAIPSSTGGYPWRIAGDSATIVYVKNVTAQPLQYTLQLSFAGGVSALGLKMVEGGQTVALDLRALRDHQVPDARGQTIPFDATSGQVLWSWAQQAEGEEARGLIGRAEHNDTAHGMSSTYACANCCGDSFFDGFISPGEISGFPGTETLCDSMQQNENCYGTLLEPFRVSAIWSSSNTSVATISGGLETALNQGSATLSGRWHAIINFSEGAGRCESRRINPIASAYAAPCNRSTSRTPGTLRMERITLSRCLTSKTSTVTSMRP